MILYVWEWSSLLPGDCETVSHRDTGEMIWTSDQVHTLLANCLTVNPDLDDPTNTSYIGISNINTQQHSTLHWNCTLYQIYRPG